MGSDSWMMGSNRAEMEVFITSWALQSYLVLKHERVFTDEEYREKLRPAAELLKADYPSHEKFRDSRFWSKTKDRAGVTITDGYKMKWHNIGSGQVQLRLLVVLYQDAAYLCDAYVKNSRELDQRKMAILKNRVRDVHKGVIVIRGKL
jgi:hypothetical protein